MLHIYFYILVVTMDIFINSQFTSLLVVFHKSQTNFCPCDASPVNPLPPSFITAHKHKKIVITEKKTNGQKKQKKTNNVDQKA